jgi:hypothetical protein
MHRSGVDVKPLDAFSENLYTVFPHSFFFDV